jgi:hypothetical protein
MLAMPKAIAGSAGMPFSRSAKPEAVSVAGIGVSGKGLEVRHPGVIAEQGEDLVDVLVAAGVDVLVAFVSPVPDGAQVVGQHPHGHRRAGGGGAGNPGRSAGPRQHDF